MTDKFHSLVIDKKDLKDQEVVLIVDQEDFLTKTKGQESGEKRGPSIYLLEAADHQE